MKYNLIDATQEDLQQLYDKSALTIEGLDVNAIPDWLEILYGYFKDEYKEKCIDIFNVSGKLMNTAYHLTGSNTYPDDLPIVVIRTLDYFKDDLIDKLSLARFAWGGRWFDDVVENNLAREER